jgi:hypothetical protein
VTPQLRRVLSAVRDGRFRTLEDIASVTGDPPASVRIQMLHLKEPRFGGWLVEKRRRGGWIWEYRLAGQQG